MTTITHDLSDADYRAHAGLSQSALKKLARSPAHFRHAQDHHPTEGTPAMLIGRLFHHLSLTPDVPPWWSIKPEGMSFATKEGKAWRETATGTTILTADQWEQASGMADAVRRCSAVPVFTHTEVSVFGERTTGSGAVAVKGRLDAVDEDGNIFDLKSCQDARPVEFSKTLANYGYAFQAAFYLDLYGAKLFHFVAVESEPPHAIKVYRLSAEAVEVGRAEVARLLALYAFCKANDEWPAYDEAIETITLPKWAMV